jgi:hypothetical protein
MLSQAISDLFSSIKKALPYLVIFLICMIAIVFLVSMGRNVSKLSSIGNDSPNTKKINTL